MKSLFSYFALLNPLISVVLSKNTTGQVFHSEKMPSRFLDSNLINDGISQNGKTQSLLSLQERLSTYGKIKADQKVSSNNLLSYGRNYLWQVVWGTLKNFKSESSVWTVGSDGSPTLTKFHLIVVPVWWDGAYDINEEYSTEQAMDALMKTKTYYQEMSWGKHDLTYELWDRTVLEGVSPVDANWGNSETAVRNYVSSYNLVEFQDYTGIALVLDQVPNTPFDGFNWGSTNGNIMWLLINLDFGVTRHELGHNYGHPHHKSNTYDWRFKRGSEEQEGLFDEFDFMSSGNGYKRSDLAAASKWFFNWIPDSSIILMQPEGSSTLCPTCVASVQNLVLFPFDDPNVKPSPQNKMAIQIPITSKSDGSSNTLYSYWLSYRGISADGLASGGLSVHVSWFRLGGIFGAYYDSLNYDAYGDTTTKLDSFVTPGTCYVVNAPGVLMDVDPASVDQVVPVVCVKSVNRGVSITVSVSFLNKKSPPPKKITLASDRLLSCSTKGSNSGSISLPMVNSNPHLISYNSTGKSGTITLNLCRQSTNSPNATVYFYDAYPYAYMAYNSPPGYGAFKSLKVTSLCSTTQSIDYLSEYSETYALVIKDASSPLKTSPIVLRSSCKVTTCEYNQYMGTDGRCYNCPTGAYSPRGSTSVSACRSCTFDGMILEHPKASSGCYLSGTSNPLLITGSQWRLFTAASLTTEKWVWDINTISFYSSKTCSPSSKVSTIGGKPFDSGNAGPYYAPSGAFDTTDQIWGGRPDNRALFWIGLDFTKNVTVRCITMNQPQNEALEVRVQTRPSSKSSWSNVVIAKGLKKGDNKIVIAEN